MVQTANQKRLAKKYKVILQKTNEQLSACSALTQMTNDWLKDMYRKNVGAVLLDFSSAFDVIDHNLLLKKRLVLWICILCLLLWIESYLSNRTKNFC
jgi:hypothetical protein